MTMAFSYGDTFFALLNYVIVITFSYPQKLYRILTDDSSRAMFDIIVSRQLTPLCISMGFRKNKYLGGI